MKTTTAIVMDSKRLELHEGLSLPTGTLVHIQIEEELEDDYAARLEEYYRKSDENVLAEERALAERLSASDPCLPAEDPWW